MDSADDLNTLAGRLATFDRPHHSAKRRASSAKKKAQSTLSWPHETPTPQDLARAGFYYKPSAASQDSVTCFLCQKALDGWEPGDNPANEHLSHVPNCGWAINVCIEQRSQDMDRAEEDPHSEHMMESRRATFRDAWPHEGLKGWKCKISKMVEAGWCYTPLPEADDCVHCFYCGVSLDGWEPKDDPWDEHRKRAPDCHFFSLLEESKLLKQQGKKSKGRPSRASKAARASTQSRISMVSEPPSMIDREDEPAEEDDTILTVASTTSRATKGSRKAVKKAAPKRARSTRKRDDSMMGEEGNTVESLIAVQTEPSTSTPDEAVSVAQPAKARAKRQPKRLVSHVVDIQPTQIEAQPTARKGPQTQKTQKHTNVAEDASQLQSELEASTAPPVDAPRPARGKKRTSDGLEKLDSLVVAVENAPLPPVEKSRPVKRGRPTKKTAEPVPEDTVDQTYDIDDRMLQSGSERANGEDKAEAHRGKGLTHSGLDVEPGDAPLPEPSQRQQGGQILTGKPGSMSDGLPPTPPTKPNSRAHSRSPQTSDAENMPPSSRPSLGGTQQASQAVRMPLASTPQGSPNKRNILPAVSTIHPWNAIDLERIFLPSPSSRPLVNHLEKDKVNLENALMRLTSPEKKMSVEEWILRNAEGAEARLKAECERLIWKFEGEGNRALRSLEGVEVA